MLGPAVSKPRPETGSETMLLSKNQALMKDKTYRNCYKKVARGDNVGHSLIGCGAWIVFALVLL